MNKRIKLILISALIAALLCVFLTACGNPVAEIYVDKSGMPTQTSFIQGQDMSLKGGVLTVVQEDGTKSLIPLDSPEISVSGYDKDSLGKQSLTVSYQEKTTTLEVTVVARIVADSYESNYFVNDCFNKTKGKLKITRDNMSAFSVNMNDPAVKITSFDSSKAGKIPVGVEYTAADGTVYSGSFNVEVFDIADILFTAPTKKVYSSHEEIDVTGGYFTVTAGGSSSFTKYVNITEDMYSGFDTSVVTKDNLVEPYPQTVTFSYGGKEFAFPIEIYYSGVYVIESAAEALASIDWSDRETTVSDEDGQMAYEAILQYFKLSDADKALISEEDIHTVVRPAALYVNKLYAMEFERFGDAIAPSTSGIYIVGESYEAIAEAVECLKDDEDMVNVYAELIRDIVEEFGDVVYTEEITVSRAVFIFTEDYQGFIITGLEYMMELYDILEDIPTDWDLETLAANSDIITDAATRIKVSEFRGYQYYQLYSVLSSWREKNDFLEIIYSYYYYVAEDGKDKLAEGLWKDIPFPGILSEWYMYLSNAAVEASNLEKNKDDGAYLRDISTFMFYYKQTVELINEIKAMEGSLYLDVYNYMGCESLFYTAVRDASYGFLYNMGAGLESEAITELWDEYIKLLEVVLTGTDVKIADHAEEVELIFNKLTSLTPAELNIFLRSLHFLYDTSAGDVLVFTIGDTVYSNFTYLLSTYYLGAVGEEVYPIYCKLMLAMENYSLVGIKDSALEDFSKLMGEIVDARAALSDEDQAAFDRYFSGAFNKMKDIYDVCSGEKTADAGSFGERFLELKATLDRLDALVDLINLEDTTNETKNRVIPVIFALYERADRLYNEIRSADESVVLALYSLKYGDDTLDRLHNAVKTYITRFMVNTFITVKDGEGELKYRTFDLYHSADIQDFLADAAYIMNAGVEGELPTAADVSAAMAALRELDDLSKERLITLGVLRPYYEGLEAYYHSILPDADELVDAILAAEYQYLAYETEPTPEALTAFNEKMAAAIALYDPYENKDSLGEDLLSVYRYYLEKYNSANTEA